MNAPEQVNEATAAITKRVELESQISAVLEAAADSLATQKQPPTSWTKRPDSAWNPPSCRESQPKTTPPRQRYCDCGH